MKPIATLAAAVLATSGSAAELSPKLLGLIGTDVSTVAGADLVRQGNSALNQFFQSSVVPGADARASYRKPNGSFG